VAAYESVGFKYVYNQSTTPTNANYAANVQAMQSAGAQYVTEYSDASSAERLSSPCSRPTTRPRWWTGSPRSTHPSSPSRPSPSPTATWC
jgi:hypothetical protein